jgi:hypothetical protein
MSASRFTGVGRLFGMTSTIKTNIRADAEIVWHLLIDARGFPRWNSTITAIDGEIHEGERLELNVPGTKHTFTPTVSGVVPRRRMVWSEGILPVFRGVRTFVLERCLDGSTNFKMEQRFSGLVFALVKRKLPDFRPIFEAFADDLKREAEYIAREHESAWTALRRGA